MLDRTKQLADFIDLWGADHLNQKLIDHERNVECLDLSEAVSDIASRHSDPAIRILAAAIQSLLDNKAS